MLYVNDISIKLEKSGYACNGVLFSLQKEGNSEYATTWMNIKGIMLIEISQSQK